ncbi:hypothetical protein EDM00_11420 [Ornithobacterium rhinotracheale]|uniref:hypothetical protein n=1 Tax=Ornithobacterium rhinotracheale TaxID=28251 RepID=UPI00129C37A1|nr:hypothetical protein [Ornithobacterium rhinotracheale]MRI64588.1 hypothetical protein [Ornithobacterium rhinotracheale]
MEKSNQKFKELVKRMKTLKETETGKLKGGITVLKSVQNSYSIDANNYGVCTNTGGDDRNYGVCTRDNKMG